MYLKWSPDFVAPGFTTPLPCPTGGCSVWQFASSVSAGNVTVKSTVHIFTGAAKNNPAQIVGTIASTVMPAGTNPPTPGSSTSMAEYFSDWTVRGQGTVQLPQRHPRRQQGGSTTQHRIGCALFFA